MDNYTDYAVAQLSTLLRQFSMQGSIIQGTITAVNKDDNTCTVSVEDAEGGSLEWEGVPLRVLSVESNYMIYPKPGTDCSVCFYGGNTRSPAVLDFQDAESIKITGQTNIDILSDQITLNNGDLGGIIKINTLTNKLNALVDAFNNHTHNVTGVQPGTGSVVAPAPTGKAAEFVAADYEDTKITH